MSSDNTNTPPKPKPGSLRDRIAAFENKASTAVPAGPPPPRPKPAGFATWKPKQPSPPDSPSAGASASVSTPGAGVGGGAGSGSGEGVVRGGSGGMNVVDAKESITRAGGSLKERMAALQGRGAFGGAPAPSPPPVASNKPRWKPPPQPVVVPAAGDDVDESKDKQPVQEEGEEEEEKDEGQRVLSNPPSIKSPPPIVRSPKSDLEDDVPEATGIEATVGEPIEGDEEEEQRQRRAAIAARMAKLGGARIGMGPPVFGRPSVPAKKPSVPEPEAVPAAEEELEPTTEATPESSPRPPLSMPVPAMPKRAGPPRRKAAKSTSAGAITSPEESPVPPSTEAPASISVAEESAAHAVPLATEDDDVIQPEPTRVGEENAGTDEPEAGEVEPETKEPEVSEEPLQEGEGEDEDEDEELRKRRVAEKLAKMGGVNPFALPSAPLRRTSVGSTTSASAAEPSAIVSPPTSPPVPTPARKSSVGASPTNPLKPIPAGKPASLRRGSMESGVSLEGSIARRTSVGSVASVGSVEPPPVRRASIGSLKSITKVAEVEVVEEPESIPEAEEEDKELREGAKKLNVDEDEKESDHHHADNIASQEQYDHEVYSHDTIAEGEDEDEDEYDREDNYDDATPQPAARVPHVAVAGTRSVDPGIVASVIPPPPSRPPPTTIPDDATTGTTVLPPPRIVQGSREPSIDRTSGPVQPRRIVPQTPEDRPAELDDDGSEDDVHRDVSDEEEEEGGEDLTQSTLFVPPPRDGGSAVGVGLGAEVDEGEESEPPLRVPPPVYNNNNNQGGSEEALPVRVGVDALGEESRVGRPSRAVPPPPPPPSRPVAAEEESGSEYAEEEVEEEDVEEKVLRTRPLSGGQKQEEDEEREILDEEEGDPIDPAFHLPERRSPYLDEMQAQPLQTQGQRAGRSSTASLSPSSATAATFSRPPVPVSASGEVKDKGNDKEEGEEEDGEKAKRQTIAERMARLGGIRFGAAPVPVPGPGRPPVPVPRKSSGEYTEGVQGEQEEKEEQSQEERRAEEEGGDEEEEEERARRERIAAKLAGMGGMRIGMMPMSMPPRQSHVLQQEPPPVPAQTKPIAQGSGASESGASEDGVKVEAEESEIEEVGYEDVRGSEEGSGEEVPPPLPPARLPNRRGTGGSIATSTSGASVPTSPPARPPVPVPAPFRRQSVQSTTSMRKSQTAQSQQSEYVIVDEPKAVGETEDVTEEDVPPPPPARPAGRAPPARAAPPAPAPAASMGDSISSQWELPTIPSSSLGGDLSASWSEALLDEQATPPPPSQTIPVPVPPPAAAAPVPLEGLHLDSDDLMAVWGRVGVQICEVATTMHDQSKKTLIGDGSYRGFVDAVLAEVPNAAKPPTRQIPYGYIVYLQNGAQVQKRASEIMPGDIVEIVDARFKGHRGLGGYQQHVGTGVEGGEGGGPVLGVVSEFETKKSKVRVFQANQHVGQQTVEAASYRLEDLKSGLVKVYRVLEA